MCCRARHDTYKQSRSDTRLFKTMYRDLWVTAEQGMLGFCANLVGAVRKDLGS